MEKLFLLDAYALIYRSYYALLRAPRINSKGLNTSAIMGFCNTLNEVLTKENPTYIGVAFDHGKTFRHDAFPAYKAQREETPEDIKASVPIIKDILRAYKIPILQADGFEADDIIGTIAIQAGEKGIDTYMLTPDKDYGQLIRKNVKMYRPQHGGGYEILGEKEIAQKYGISSSTQIIDLLALMGDSADNFPGCPGVGEKTAAKLINQFGSVENLLNNTSQLKGKLKEKVENAVEDIKMSYFLATIRTDVPTDIKMEDLKLQEPDADKLDEIFTELEFKSFKNKILNKSENKKKNAIQELDLFAVEQTDGQTISKNASFETIKTHSHEYKLIDNEEDSKILCDFLLTFKNLSLDTETTSTNAIDAELVGLSFAVEENKAFYVAIPAEREKALRIVNIFKPLYENKKILKIGQNIKYDYEVLLNYDIEIKGKMFDTMIAHYLIQPELHHNMDYLAEVFLNYQTIHIEELIGPKGKNQKNMRDLNPKDVYEYAAEDADITLRLKNVLEPKLGEVKAEHLFWEIEMPLIPVLADMERNGICLDTNALQETSKVFTERMRKYEEKIYEEAAEKFNISSPKQVGDILFGKMHIMEKPKKTKTGQYVTSEEVLQSIRAKNPIVENILNYRGMKKLLSTYVDNLPTLINKRTGHIHTSFNQALTATGRLSSSDPNLQNIPVRTDDGKEIRKCFIPEPGCLFFSADYSQIELRIMAHLSGDENMIEAFREGFDIHRATAAKIWHEEIDKVTDSQRKKAKQANFGIIYGITTYGLAQRMNISNSEAKDLITDYFKTFPKVQAYMEKAKEAARKNGYAETIFGRRRYLADINSHNGTVRGFAERNAINAPIQGSEADIIKVAMIKIWNRFRQEGIKSKMILQVHDELNFSVYPEEKEKVEQIVIQEMQNAFHLDVPLTADAGWGNNWLEAH
ncbi:MULTISPECIES: DNA polymerase I [Segatella]|uniref:DNA polymerase I n=2 Tax=Segatella TaxID=2974251 RepID=D8DXN5_9BACT|nr:MULTISPECIES: DNA polymerase I [Segatella]EFI71842.1 DNA polymerase type I [Segatella baroniae B14]UKK77874.1 DNA polymerase I [Segatella baroniae B14]GJG27852.1 DNA polymerase I [Segatella bryantii]SEP98588.1 DNA polymerase I [Segatella baroniae B14]